MHRLLRTLKLIGTASSTKMQGIRTSMMASTLVVQAPDAVKDCLVARHFNIITEFTQIKKLFFSFYPRQ
jgi:hypothetical protein